SRFRSLRLPAATLVAQPLPVRRAVGTECLDAMGDLVRFKRPTELHCGFVRALRRLLRRHKREGLSTARTNELKRHKIGRDYRLGTNTCLAHFHGELLFVSSHQSK